MGVDLSDYIAALVTEITPPNGVDFASVNDDIWLQTLMNAFWEARLDGLLASYTCDENGIVSPILVTVPVQPDMGRDMVQLVVLYASFSAIRNTLRDLRTMFKASAGPVSFEYMQSANLLVEIMKDLVLRRNIILTRLSDLGAANAYVIDALVARDNSLIFQNSYWISSGSNGSSLYGLSG